MMLAVTWANITEDTLNAKAGRLATHVQAVVAKAKQGIELDTLRRDMQDIKAKAYQLAKQSRGQVSGDGINVGVHAMTSGLESHEVLQVMSGEDTLTVLSGRILLSLNYLDTAAKALQNALLESDNPVIEPFFTALVIGSESLTRIISQTAVEVAKVEAAKGSTPAALGKDWRKNGDQIVWKIVPKIFNNDDNLLQALPRRSFQVAKKRVIKRDWCILCWPRRTMQATMDSTDSRLTMMDTYAGSLAENFK